ncbi:hypothetical protein, partial [Empedobacter sp. UBA3239]
MKIFKNTFFLTLSFFTILSSCNTQILKSSSNNELLENEESSLVHTRELKIFKRFDTPPNYGSVSKV